MLRNITITLLFCLLAVVGCEPPPPATKFSATPDQDSQTSQPAELEQVKAGVGVGKQGRSLDEHEGVVVTPVKTLFAAKEKIAFEIQVPSMMNTYKALNDGKGPQSHEEFMEKIIQEGQIPLPKLPEGHRYLYDPATEQLMVERPKNAPLPKPE